MQKTSNLFQVVINLHQFCLVSKENLEVQTVHIENQLHNESVIHEGTIEPMESGLFINQRKMFSNHNIDKNTWFSPG